MKYEALHSWRGIAAIAIVLLHSYGSGINGGKPEFMNGFYLFVDFFFCLSGFVMMHGYGDKIRSGGIKFKEFVIKRLLRLYPLHFVTMVASAIITQNFDALILFHQTFLIHAVVFSDNFIFLNGSSWSISAEFWAYILFFLCLAKWDSKKLVLLSLSCSLFIMVFHFVGVNYYGMNTTGKYGLIRCLAGFCMGAALYLSKDYIKGLVGSGYSTLKEICSTVVAMSFICTVGMWPLSCLAPIVFAILVYVFSEQKGALSKAITTRLFIYLGTISYSIYMIHMPIKQIFDQIEGFSYITHINIYLLTVIALSSVTYFLIEKPAYKLKRSTGND